MARCLLVSSDNHANPTLEQFRSYFDPAYREQYDTLIAQRNVSNRRWHGSNITIGGKMADPFGESVRRAWDSAMEEAGVKDPASDPDIRLRELDRDGVTGEVIFPVGGTPNDAPLLLEQSTTIGQPYDLLVAAARAYNRWLADFCSASPERRAGVAVIPPLSDVAVVVKEIEWARKAGLRGGILLPAMLPGNTDYERFLHHPRFEPMWAACEELDMPVNSHIENLLPDYGPSPGSLWIISHDMAAAKHRTFWFLLWSGVFARHPRLKYVVTESGGNWAIFHLQRADQAYKYRNTELARTILHRKPSEYWARQCYIGASPPSGRGEVEQRHILGVNNIMWGSDYPHKEGAWPFTQKRLATMFTGIPENEVRQMVGLNAARAYNFEIAKLLPVANRIGPAAGEWEHATTASQTIDGSSRRN